MKPGLALSRFYARDAVRAEKIDEQLKLIAEQVNGGLTAQNLASDLKLPTTLFSENKSIVTLQLTGQGQTAGTNLCFGAPPDGSSSYTVLGIGWNLLVSSASIYRSVTASFGGVSVVAGNIQTRNAITVRGGVILYGFSWLDGMEPFLDNAGPMYGTWTCVGAETMKGTVTAVLAMDHTS